MRVSPSDLHDLIQRDCIDPVSHLRQRMQATSLSFPRPDVGLAAPPRVIAVRMGHHRPVHRKPRIDEEVTSLAIEAAVGYAKHWAALEGKKGTRKTRRLW